MSKSATIPVFVRLLFLYFHLLFSNRKERYGVLWSKPAFFASLASFISLYWNFGGIGNSYATPKENRYLFQTMEIRVIEWLKKVMGVFDSREQWKSEDMKIEGYVTSGGTESNIFCGWLGKEWLKHCASEKGDVSKPPILLKTVFTHYSITKAARILDLQCENVAVNTNYYGLDIRVLIKTVYKYYKQHGTQFLIPVTLGYSSTGTFDPLERILKVVQLLEKKLPGTIFFIWIDAASQGFPLAFLDSSFRPFKDSHVQGLVIDFHKLGLCPVPSAAVLYRKHLRGSIQNDIEYLAEKDATLLGSRPGSAIISIWTVISSKSVKWWRAHFKKLLVKRKQVQRYFEDFGFTTLSQDKSLTFAIIESKKVDAITLRYLIDKHWLHFSSISFYNQHARRETLNHAKVVISD